MVQSQTVNDSHSCYTAVNITYLLHKITVLWQSYIFHCINHVRRECQMLEGHGKLGSKLGSCIEIPLFLKDKFTQLSVFSY